MAESDKSTSGTKTGLAKRSSSKKKKAKKTTPAKRKTKKKASGKRKTTKGATRKKAAVNRKTKKKTTKAAKKNKGPGRIRNEWTLVTLDEILAYKAATGLTDKQLAKQFDISGIARMKKGRPPVQETQERIRKVIAGKGGAAPAKKPRTKSTSGKIKQTTDSSFGTLSVARGLLEDSAAASDPRKMLALAESALRILREEV